MTCFVGTKEVSCSSWGSANQSGQVGSQWWLNAGREQPGGHVPGFNAATQVVAAATGIDPETAIKRAFTKADYARDWAGNYAKMVTATDPLASVAIQKIASTYPGAAPANVSVWQAVPSIAPTISAVQGARTIGTAENLAQGGATYTTSTGTTGSTQTGNVGTGGGDLGSQFSSLLSSPIALIAILIGAYLLLKPSGSGNVG